MMRTFIICLNMLLLSVCLLFGCSRRSSNPLLLQADSLLSVRPDSVLAMLDSLSGVEDMPASDRAFYALLWAQALDKVERPLLPCDSLLEFALDYYDDDDLEKAVALLYKGRLLAQMADEKAAIEYNLKALEVLKEYPEDRKYRCLIYGALELWYGNSGLYNKALEMFNLLLAYSSSVKDTAIGYNNIGRIYIMRDMQDSAIFYQRKSMEYAAYSKNTDMMLTSWHSLSICYGQFNLIDSAIYYARKVIQNISSSHQRCEKYYYNIGDLYISVEEYDSARYYLEKSLSHHKFDVVPYWSLAVMEAELNNFQSAYHYLDTFVIMQDSLNANSELTEIQHLVYKHQTESQVKDEQMKSRKRVGVIVLISVIACFLLVLIFQYRLSKRDKRHALYEQSLQYTKEKLEVMQQRIKENEFNLTLLREKENQNLYEIDKKEALIAQLKQEKLELRTWLFRQTPIYKKVLSLSGQQKVDKKDRKVMADAELGKLKKTVFEIYADYISPLQAQYPRLTEDDLLLLCLQEADIPALTIALCFGHADTVALNQRKSRLKAKMSEM